MDFKDLPKSIRDTAKNSTIHGQDVEVLISKLQQKDAIEVFKIESVKLDFDFIKSSSNTEGVFESNEAMNRIENMIEDEYRRHIKTRQ